MGFPIQGLFQQTLKGVNFYHRQRAEISVGADLRVRPPGSSIDHHPPCFSPHIGRSDGQLSCYAALVNLLNAAGAALEPRAFRVPEPGP